MLVGKQIKLVLRLRHNSLRHNSLGRLIKARGFFTFLIPLLLIACLNADDQNQKLNNQQDSQQKAYNEENEIIAQIFEDITGGEPLPLFLKISYGGEGAGMDAMTPVFSSHHWQINHHLGTTYLSINVDDMWNKKHLVHTKKMHEDGSGNFTRYLDKIEESFLKIPGARVRPGRGTGKIISIPYFELIEPVNNTLRKGSQMDHCDGELLAFVVKTAPLSENQDQILKAYGNRKEKTAQLNACVYRVGNKINVLGFKVTFVKTEHYSSLPHYGVSDIPQLNLSVGDK